MKEKDLSRFGLLFTACSVFGRLFKRWQSFCLRFYFIFSFFFSFFHFRKTTPQCLAETCNVRDAPVASVVRENSTKDRKAVQSLIALCKQVQQCFQAFEVLPTCQVLASNNLTRTCDLLRDHFIDIVS